MTRNDFIRLLSFSMVMPGFVEANATSGLEDPGGFSSRLLPAPVGGGLVMDDYWIWDPSVIKAEDGQYHMFASRWSKDLGFGNWVTNAEIVRAVAARPEGPYRFEEVVLPARGGNWFDAKGAFNPRITRYKNQYLLYYVGNTYDFAMPDNKEDIWADGRAQRAWMYKRTGLATASSITGPWKRVDKPLMEPRPGQWDASIISNPSPVVRPDGSIYLMYKSSAKNHTPPLLLGATLSKNGYLGPYERLTGKPVFSFHDRNQPDNDVEDPFVWWANGHYEVIMKDRFGHICGEAGGGIHATSKDGVAWKLSDPVKAYSRHVKWDDGTTVHMANFERPFLLFEEGKPTHLFAATGTGPAMYEVDKTWNMVIPLKH